MVSYEVLIGIWLLLGAVNLLSFALIEDNVGEDTYFVVNMAILLLAAGPLVVAPMLYALCQEIRYYYFNH